MFGDAWTLNHYAWTLFQFCDDVKQLKKAIPWADMAIGLDSTAYNFNYYDTKANLLYRLNKVKEAIRLEEIAVARSKSRKDIVENLEKMKAGEPTWIVKDENN